MGNKRRPWWFYVDISRGLICEDISAVYNLASHGYYFIENKTFYGDFIHFTNFVNTRYFHILSQCKCSTIIYWYLAHSFYFRACYFLVSGPSQTKSFALPIGRFIIFTIRINLYFYNSYCTIFYFGDIPRQQMPLEFWKGIFLWFTFRTWKYM